MLAIVRKLLQHRRRGGWPLEAYGTHLRLEVAQRSVGTRLYAIKLFARSHPDPWGVDRRQVEAYLAALTGRDGGPAAHSYRRSVLASIRGFYRWALDNQLTRHDPTAGIRLGQGRDGHGRPCDEFTVRRALRDAADSDERLMVELVCRAALRVCEVASVRGDRVQPDGRWLLVVGKGSKERLVPLDPDLRDAILAGGPGWRFPGGRGREGTHITPGNVGVKIGRLLRPYSAHSGRHRAARVVYKRTHDLEAVRQVLGHESIATTQLYLGVSSDDVWETWTGAIAAAEQPPDAASSETA